MLPDLMRKCVDLCGNYANNQNLKFKIMWEEIETLPSETETFFFKIFTDGDFYEDEVEEVVKGTFKQYPFATKWKPLSK